MYLFAAQATVVILLGLVLQGISQTSSANVPGKRIYVRLRVMI